jgi:DNA-binding XRE family transcriptional regulator
MLKRILLEILLMGYKFRQTERVCKLNYVRIQKIRIERGMSQKELAHAAGVTTQTIYLIENNRVKNPKEETLRAIAKALLVDYEDLFY